MYYVYILKSRIAIYKSGGIYPAPLSRQKSGAGFTLIETLLYVALFTIMIGGCLLAAYSIIQSADSTSAKSVLQEDANFILRKIEWAMSGASSIAVPSPDTAILTRSGTMLTFSLNGGNVTLRRNSNSPLRLNSQNGDITGLSFVYTPSAGSKPASLEASLTLSAQGKTLSATSTKFLRQ